MRLLVFLILIFYSFSIRAEIPTFTGHVVDAANVLSDEVESRLIKQLATIQSSYVVLITTPDLAGLRIDYYMDKVHAKWKQHPEIQNPVYFIISTNPKFMYLTSTRQNKLFQNNDILFNSLRADLRRRDYDAVFTSAANQIITAIEQDDSQTFTPKTTLATPASNVEEDLIKVSTPPIQKTTMPKDEKFDKKSLRTLIIDKTKTIQLNAPIPYTQMILWMIPFVLLTIFGTISEKRLKVPMSILSALCLIIGLIAGFTIFPLEMAILIGVGLTCGFINILLEKIFGPFKLPLVINIFIMIGACTVSFFITHPTQLANWLGLGLTDTFLYSVVALTILSIITIVIGTLFPPKENREEQDAFNREADAFARKIANWFNPKRISIQKTIDRFNPKPTQPVHVSTTPIIQRPAQQFSLLKHIFFFILSVVGSAIGTFYLTKEGMSGSLVPIVFFILFGTIFKVLNRYNAPARHGSRSFKENNRKEF